MKSKDYFSDEFKSPEELNLKLPLLILAIEVPLYETEKPKEEAIKDRCYNFKGPERWIMLAHQTAGHACHHHYFYASVLKPTPEAKVLMCELEKHWYESDCGMFNVSLDEVLEYRKQLLEFGVDCNSSYRDFEEGIYPIDCESKNLKLLCEDELPEDLNEFIEWEDDWDRLIGIIGRWKLFILGENCD
jgi:hypothetical protein